MKRQLRVGLGVGALCGLLAAGAFIILRCTVGSVSGGGISGDTWAIGNVGTISPGNSPGVMTTGSLTWNNGGSYTWEIDDAAGLAGSDPGWDLVNITGSLTLNVTDGGFTIIITSLSHSDHLSGVPASFVGQNPPVGSPDYSFEIARTTEGINAFSPSAFTLDDSGFVLSGWSWAIRSSGNSLYLDAFFAAGKGTVVLFD